MAEKDWQMLQIQYIILCIHCNVSHSLVKAGFIVQFYSSSYFKTEDTKTTVVLEKISKEVFLSLFVINHVFYVISLNFYIKQELS